MPTVINIKDAIRLKANDNISGLIQVHGKDDFLELLAENFAKGLRSLVINQGTIAAHCLDYSLSDVHMAIARALMVTAMDQIERLPDHACMKVLEELAMITECVVKSKTGGL